MSQHAGKTLAPERPAASNNTVTVTVTLDEAEGRLTCSPNPIYLRPGQTVEWSFDDGPWAVLPVGLSPFDVRSIQGGKGAPGSASPSRKAPFGRYEYVIAVEKDGKVWLEDPELIFGPPRG